VTSGFNDDGSTIVASSKNSSVKPQRPRAEQQTLAAQPAASINPQSLLRLPEVLALFPICRSSWWRGIQLGRYPKPVKLGPRACAWRAADILRLVEESGTEVWPLRRGPLRSGDQA
jgi:predicted DNA-binding transcriptional regulator AlpA